MKKTEEFNQSILKSYRSISMNTMRPALYHLAAPSPIIQVKEGDVRYHHQLTLKLEEKPQVTLRMISGLTYQEEMERKSFVRQMRRVELVYKNLEQPASVEEVVKELAGQGSSSAKINEMKKEIVRETTQEVRHIVQTQVRDQAGTLADKVYRRLERSLQDEKRRRGY